MIAKGTFKSISESESKHNRNTFSKNFQQADNSHALVQIDEYENDDFIEAFHQG